MTAKHYPFGRDLNVRSAYGPTFAPAGDQLSFLSDITGVAEVWSVSLGGTTAPWPEQLTFWGERVFSVRYSPQEPVMLVAADTGGSELDQFYTLSQNGSAFLALTSQPRVMHR